MNFILRWCKRFAEVDVGELKMRQNLPEAIDI